MTVEQTWIVFILMGALLNYFVLELNYVVVLALSAIFGFIVTTYLKLSNKVKFEESSNHDSSCINE